MTSKNLWTICFLLMFILIVVIGQGVYASEKSVKWSVAGVKTELPQLNKESLAKPPQKRPDSKDPNINSKAAILIDVESFKTLYQENSDLKVPIASTTKIMTALVVLEDYPDKMNDIVSLTGEMVNVEGSDAQLRSSEKISVENLLKGALIVSGNDAAYSLASYLGGKDQFVNKMNEKAKYLGLNDTSYKDPAGLNDEGYSSANNLAILGAYALRNNTFADIVKTPEVTVVSSDGAVVHDFKSSNRMLRTEEQYYYPFAIGIKTGFTLEAGHCLVSAAEKDGHRLVAVVLNTNENTVTASAKESRKLLDWGFNNWVW
ncbi:MAG: Serine-type D-Ala-D-Ala carboxypeptidase [Berkelbacteria bacterium GW2011_GWA1_36_9]|uniref:Serine-type D-Ala-D-Ala carboxypeptidase n=1 Tax=Berkelbacteria bacterium GW2011_GWA1_36_9 TaxID=1618331 RepID=A0A0G0IQF8_9BACT|nr:MAG: Serine-type D-Ala-D-Ala carboxypeptidase [Berkelbacteria bacterium GW2011_GWA1_36_9]